MICPPCREAVDAITAAVQTGEIEPTHHDPKICRDRKIQPAGCPCQHKPVPTRRDDQ